MGDRFGTMRATAAIGLLLLSALGSSASAASADPLSMTFTEARANVGVQLSDDALFEAPATAPFEAQIDPGTGSITGGYLHVPQFSTHITSPIDADVDVIFDYDLITGSFDQGSGALTLSGETVATLASTEKECNISTTPAVLTLSTTGSSGGTSPRSGAPFAHGLTGAGAIAGEWTDMHATPVDPGPGGDTFFCEDVEDQIGGPGGVWLEHAGDLVPPLAPRLHVDPPPPPHTCVVPTLVGKKLGRAKSALKAAGCKLGQVTKPARHKGKHRPLIVKSSTPSAGATPADGVVDLTLRPKPRKARGA